jgi:hypothetical protein
MKKKELLKRIEALEEKINTMCKCDKDKTIFDYESSTNIHNKIEEKIKEDLETVEKDVDFFEWWDKISRKEKDSFYESGSMYVEYIDYLVRIRIAVKYNQDKYQLARAILIYEIDKYNKNNNQTWGLEDFNSVVLDVSHYDHHEPTKRFMKKISNYNGINVWNWYFGIKED